MYAKNYVNRIIMYVCVETDTHMPNNILCKEDINNCQ